jgi:heme-degrading monooxygenase HmoA
VFARMTIFRGSPDRIEEGVRVYRDQVIPWLRDATGFRGWVVLIDRQNEKAIGLTFWATEQAALAGESSGGVLRDEVAASVGATMESLELYEVHAVESLQLGDAG